MRRNGEDVCKLLMTMVCCYVVISTLLQTKDEFRFIIPYVEFSKQVKGRSRWSSIPVSLSTAGLPISVIRGLSTRKLIVPRFVLQELQGIADSSDKLKRNRGRRGLDILKRLQTNPKVELQMHEANCPSCATSTASTSGWSCSPRRSAPGW